MMNKNKEFLLTLINETLLDDAIDWIKMNLNPEEVFNDNDLEDWAYENGFTKNEDDEHERCIQRGL